MGGSFVRMADVRLDQSVLLKLKVRFGPKADVYER